MSVRECIHRVHQNKVYSFQQSWWVYFRELLNNINTSMWSVPRYHKSTRTKLQSLCETFPKAKNCWASPQVVQVPGCWWAESCASFQYCFCSIANKIMNYVTVWCMSSQMCVLLLHQWACYSSLVCAWRSLRHRKSDLIGKTHLNIKFLKQPTPTFFSRSQFFCIISEIANKLNRILK